MLKKRGDSSSTNYQVGYGRPPPQSQFKPGQSGNPKGRPKGIKDFDTICRDMCVRRVPVQIDGKILKVPAEEAFGLLLLKEALSGDRRAMAYLLAGAARAPQPYELPKHDFSKISPEEAARVYKEIMG